MNSAPHGLIDSFKVMTFNVQLLPNIAMRRVDARKYMPKQSAWERGRRVAKLIKDLNPHIVVLTEVWDNAGFHRVYNREWQTPKNGLPRTRLVASNNQGLVTLLDDYGWSMVCAPPGSLKSNYFRTITGRLFAPGAREYGLGIGDHGGSIIFAKRGWLENGGQITALDRHALIFENGASYDVAVNKGATLVNFHHDDAHFTVIGTHMQADQEIAQIPQYRAIRQAQLRDIIRWARPLVHPRSIGVFFAGDFNIPYYIDDGNPGPVSPSSEALGMLHRLAAIQQTNPGYTYDCVNNRRARAYSGDAYFYYQNTLDYIFKLNRNLTESTYATRAIALAGYYDSISDHYPITNY